MDVALEEELFVLLVGIGLLRVAAEGVIVGGLLQVLLLLQLLLLFS